MKHTVFVYGTLKRGGKNHGLLAGQNFVAMANTQPAYRLYALDGYPGLVEAGAKGRSIEGELWEIDPTCLTRLDRLEGIDLGIYARVTLPLLPPHDTLKVEGYLYLLDIEGRTDLGNKWPV